MPTLLTPLGRREGGIRSSYNNGFVEIEEDWQFDVQADNLLQSRQQILFTTPGLPIAGTIFNGLAVKGADAERDKDHGLRWRVNVTISNSLDDGSNNGQTGDPTMWTPVASTRYEVKEEMSETDWSNTPIANSAGVPYDTGVIKRRYLPMWEFPQFEPISVSSESLLSRMEVVNSVTYKNKPAKTWLCRVIDSQLGFYAGYRCRLTIYRLTYDEKKWTDKRQDKGDSYKAGSKLVPWLSKGVVITGPLNGSGGISGTLDAPGAPAIREFDMFPTSDFSFLRV